MRWPLFTLALEVENDVVAARQRARQTAAVLGFDKQDQVRVATAVSEIARNGLAYGKGGRVSFAVELGETDQHLLIVVQDFGPGIANLDAILAGSYQSKTGMGVGLTGTRRLLDDLQIVSNPGQGTTVSLFKTFPPSAARVDPVRLPDIADTIRRDAPADPYSELREQNRELIDASDSLRRKQFELETLNASLQESNRGVLALYAELEDKAAELKLASEARARLHANVSHELRTPIQSIVAIAQLLASHVDGELTEEQEKQVHYIRQSAGNLSALVDDLLDLAKTEGGRLTVDAHEFAIAQLFGTLRGALLPLVRTDSVKLEFWIDPSLSTIESDEVKVGQILRNLVSNALKFTVEGSVTVSARLLRKRVVFEVKDTGIGIEQSDHQRIFEAFEQVPNALQARAKGTGLGLSFSARLAELLGGTLAVSSVLGKGSIFTLIVPLKYVETRTFERKFLHAMVVDDDARWRSQVRAVLDPFCGRITEASTGADALMQAGLAAPDLLITDLEMPTMTGFELIEAVRKQGWSETLSIIVVSATQLLSWQRTLLGPDASVIVKNAFDPSDLRSILHRIAAGTPP